MCRETNIGRIVSLRKLVKEVDEVRVCSFEGHCETQLFNEKIRSTV